MYQREKFTDLIDMSGRNIFDETHSDMGLCLLTERFGNEAA